MFFSCRVPAFEASKYLITNSEFLEFVKAGGYETQDFWSNDGWQWLQFRTAKHPTFWVCSEGCRAGCGGSLYSFSHCKPPEHISNGHNSYCNGHSNVDCNGHQGKDEGGGHQGELYRLRCMFDVIDMPWSWPVEVNHHEAKAFCAWHGEDYRLPVEAEHTVMRGTQEGLGDDDVTNGQSNINLQYGSATPVNMFPPTERGFCDVAGNVWDWVEDHFNGLPDFNTHIFYDDYSSPTCDGKHYNILGGSWVSTGQEASRFTRFSFRAHFFQHAGFRVARSLPGPGHSGKIKLPARFLATPVYVQGLKVQDNEILLNAGKYEYVLMQNANLQYRMDTEQFMHDTLLQEYVDDSGELPAMQLAALSNQLIAKYNIAQGRALHLGCATGRTTFALATFFKQVLGVDYSGRFISTCEKLQKGEPVSVDSVSSGNVVKCSNVVALPDGLNVSRVIFKQLTWLPNEVGFFDFILITFFERVQNTKAWILRLPEILNTAGLLFVAFKDSDVKQAVMKHLADR
ncbi:hypothetical protein LSAT2_027897 [Lamellibrachia satsuma]|nr:hypothetical protein LSAT2_027897 [Lamellibrachia satsuma]